MSSGERRYSAWFAGISKSDTRAPRPVVFAVVFVVVVAGVAVVVVAALSLWSLPRAWLLPPATAMVKLQMRPWAECPDDSHIGDAETTRWFALQRGRL